MTQLPWWIEIVSARVEKRDIGWPKLGWERSVVQKGRPNMVPCLVIDVRNKDVTNYHVVVVWWQYENRNSYGGLNVPIQTHSENFGVIRPGQSETAINDLIESHGLVE